MPLLPESIRYSETLQASPAKLIDAVREQGFEGIVAKRRESCTSRASARCVAKCASTKDMSSGSADTLRTAENFDAIFIGDYEVRALRYVGKVRAGFSPAVRAIVFERFQGLETKTCPFKNLPDARRGQLGEGLTAAEIEKCRWLKPRLVATIDYLERTAANHLPIRCCGAEPGAHRTVPVGAWPNLFYASTFVIP
jgi:bifunctional non-homologous end joining protein LigD